MVTFPVSKLGQILTSINTHLESKQNIRKKRLEDRANTPDYEMGNPFNERGRAKRIYRPRRQR